MTDEAWFHVLRLERLLQQGIVEKIRLADGQIVRCPPPSIHLAKELRVEWTLGSRATRLLGGFRVMVVTGAVLPFGMELVHGTQ
jgi:hypothetical protein